MYMYIIICRVGRYWKVIFCDYCLKVTCNIAILQLLIDTVAQKQAHFLKDDNSDPCYESIQCMAQY